jgi:hypothetical protein
MNRHRRVVIAALVAGLFGYAFGPELVHAATCTGSNPCNACKNCSSCAHCAKRGGTCDVWRRAAE